MPIDGKTDLFIIVHKFVQNVLTGWVANETLIHGNEPIGRFWGLLMGNTVTTSPTKAEREMAEGLYFVVH
ncbi:MAG: hypothetical protein KJS91_11985, partial [Planctomycetes bacterium]|nr:hypothetical protein [Planctomycetota bacterium]